MIRRKATQDRKERERIRAVSGTASESAIEINMTRRGMGLGPWPVAL